MALLIGVYLSWISQPPQLAEPDVEAVLRAAGAYLAQYERAVTGDGHTKPNGAPGRPMARPPARRIACE